MHVWFTSDVMRSRRLLRMRMTNCSSVRLLPNFLCSSCKSSVVIFIMTSMVARVGEVEPV